MIALEISSRKPASTVVDARAAIAQLMTERSEERGQWTEKRDVSGQRKFDRHIGLWPADPQYASMPIQIL